MARNFVQVIVLASTFSVGCDGTTSGGAEDLADSGADADSGTDADSAADGVADEDAAEADSSDGSDDAPVVAPCDDGPCEDLGTACALDAECATGFCAGNLGALV